MNRIIAGSLLAALLCVARQADATPMTTGSISYSGIEGPFNSSGVLDTVPGNLALNVNNTPSGPTAFANADIDSGMIPYHQISHLNDGNYSNSRSWIGGYGGENNVNVNLGGAYGTVSATFAGIDLKGTFSITSFAFGSDNGNFLTSNGGAADPNENPVGPLDADTGSYHDRTVGTYYVQYTTSASPNASTADSLWTTLGSISLVDGTDDSYRHLYDLASAVNATGLRIIVPGGDRIDEIEIYGTAVPEPSVAILSGLAVVGISILQKRRARK